MSDGAREPEYKLAAHLCGGDSVCMPADRVVGLLRHHGRVLRDTAPAFAHSGKDAETTCLNIAGVLEESADQVDVLMMGFLTEAIEERNQREQAAREQAEREQAEPPAPRPWWWRLWNARVADLLPPWRRSAGRR